MPVLTNSETSITRTFDCEENGLTANDPFPITKGSGTKHSDKYGQILRLFQQIAHRTGNSVNSLILEWALLHVCMDMVKR